ncbi:MAG: hypothetical protein L6416_04795 [Candidatus Omnitrophica bacterium]|nr:hypothetical protein [Candidatus Omnitrophota bacterium]
MFNAGKKYNLAFRIISAFIIQSFLIMDIAFAAGGDLNWVKQEQASQSYLAPIVQISSPITEQTFSLIYSMAKGYFSYLQLRREEQLTDDQATKRVIEFMNRLTGSNPSSQLDFIFLANKGRPKDSDIRGALLTRINGKYICVYKDLPEFIKQDVLTNKIPIGTIEIEDENLHWSIIDSNIVARELGFDLKQAEVPVDAQREQPEYIAFDESEFKKQGPFSRLRIKIKEYENRKKRIGENSHHELAVSLFKEAVQNDKFSADLLKLLSQDSPLKRIKALDKFLRRAHKNYDLEKSQRLFIITALRDFELLPAETIEELQWRVEQEKVMLRA